MASKSRDYSKGNIIGNYVAYVYILVILSMISGFFGCQYGMQHLEFIGDNYSSLMISEFVLIFATFFLSKVNVLNFMLLFAFTFVTGMSFSPLISALLLVPDGGSILIQALVLTLVVVVGLTLFAFTTSKNFLGAQGVMLYVLLFFTVLVGLNIYLQSSFLDTLYSFIGVVIFSIYLVINTQRLLYDNHEDAISAAILIYLDILNLFLNILKIFMFFHKKD